MTLHLIVEWTDNQIFKDAGTPQTDRPTPLLSVEEREGIYCAGGRGRAGGRPIQATSSIETTRIRVGSRWDLRCVAKAIVAELIDRRRGTKLPEKFRPSIVLSSTE